MSKISVVDWRAPAALGLGIPYLALWIADTRAGGWQVDGHIGGWIDWWSHAVRNVMRDGSLTFPLWFIALAMLLGGVALAIEPVARAKPDRRYPMINLVIGLGMLAMFVWAAWVMGEDYYGGEWPDVTALFR